MFPWLLWLYQVSLAQKRFTILSNGSTPLEPLVWGPSLVLCPFNLGASSHSLSQALSLFPGMSSLKLYQRALLAPEQRTPSPFEKGDLIWWQQAWCHVAYPIVKETKILAVTPATKPWIRLGPSVSHFLFLPATGRIEEKIMCSTFPYQPS